ncbi:hypothetical protein BKA82DRAFT_1009135 [Pisolithus tinctorius]|uniref:Uncharacterized protein n=1 Tax=Pisolithus tinctorius Marx 270 TaxID=870435 RepID=A0A0C3NC89_PISTI|nr:hypothetical protein BKA82DRAFT_1009135 [Pisolithus tinctorius]KIN93188.1 hypothetical protein M404DRAFT_1009135 [Pisolithus tinctorius Marx 270]
MPAHTELDPTTSGKQLRDAAVNSSFALERAFSLANKCLSESYDKSLPNGGRYNLLTPSGSFADEWSNGYAK